MKPSRTTTVLAFFLAATTAFAAPQGRVQPDPEKLCGDFKPHEICFEKPTDGITRAEYRSEPFYAVILKSAERCAVTEEERLQTQALFPRSKVFSMRFGCDENVEENITYTNVNDELGFLAVYAGTTLEEAKEQLAKVEATGRFPGANIRKMQAVLVST